MQGATSSGPDPWSVTTTGAGGGSVPASTTSTSTEPDGELATTTSTSPTDPVDALLLGTRWTRESVELVLDAVSAVASLVLAYGLLWGDS